MRKIGVVKACGDVAEVVIVRETACGENCTNCGGCRLTETVIIADNTLKAKAGDRVVLELADREGLSIAGLVYFLPVLILLMSLVLCTLIDLSEGYTAIVSVLSLVIAFVIVKKFAKTKDVMVKIVKILN